MLLHEYDNSKDRVPCHVKYDDFTAKLTFRFKNIFNLYIDFNIY